MQDQPILVVEDDGAVRRLIVECLRGAGYRCVAVGDAESALEAAERATFAAALVDNRLPGMQGIELVRLLHAARPRLPLLLVTGDQEIADRVRGLDAGAADYLTKPFEPDVLLAHLRAHLRRQAVWTSAFEEELGRRAAVVRALGAVEPAAGPSQVARAVCDAVMATGDIEGAALAWFGEVGSLEVLASQGVLAGEAVRAHLGAREPEGLRARAARGCWLEPLGWGEELVACAPLSRGSMTVGLVLLAVHDGDGAELQAGQRALAAAADFAAVASRLLELSAAGARGDPAKSVEVLLDATALSTEFQPVQDLGSGEVVGWEALSRFTDRTPPATRFADAAAVGVGGDLELIAIEHALADSADLDLGVFVAVNLSPATVVDRESEVGALIRATDRTVVLELTEHHPVEDYSQLRAALARLAPALVAVDDAGAGFASLRHVMQLEPSFVKLDRSWVSRVDQDLARQALVAGLSHFARVTGARLVAEGVETEAERACLARLGVELGQGHLLGRPAPLSH